MSLWPRPTSMKRSRIDLWSLRPKVRLGRAVHDAVSRAKLDAKQEDRCLVLSAYPGSNRSGYINGKGEESQHSRARM